MALVASTPSGKRDGAVEGTVAALAVVVPLALLLLLLLALALKREHLIGHVHFDVLLGHAGQVGTDDELPLAFRTSILGDHPAGTNSGLAPQQLAAPGEEAGQVPSGLEPEVLEEPVHLLGESSHEGERVPVALLRSRPSPGEQISFICP